MNTAIKNARLTVNQLRAARAMLGWTARQLAEKSGVSVSTIRNFESGHVVMLNTNRRLLIQALEEAGLELLWEPKKRLVGVIGKAFIHAKELVHTDAD